MTDVTASFFRSLPLRAPQVLLTPTHGTLRIDLTSGQHVEHWYVDMAPRQAVVTREERTFDALLESTAAFFDRLVRGEHDAIAAVWRNEVTIRGDMRLLLALRRFIPSPPGTRDPREAAREQRRPKQRPTG